VVHQQAGSMFCWWRMDSLSSWMCRVAFRWWVSFSRRSCRMSGGMSRWWRGEFFGWIWNLLRRWVFSCWRRLSLGFRWWIWSFFSCVTPSCL
jgi:hypothetical protein